MSLPLLPSVEKIHDRLHLIFPEGTPHRNYCIRELAARTIFVMLYVGAIEGTEIWFRPDQATRMTDDQSTRTDRASRKAWAQESLKPRRESIQGRWYAQNTREPIRDETLRNCLITTGAVLERSDLPTTSAKPRYALKKDFAALFNPRLKPASLYKKIVSWQKTNLSSSALARIHLMRSGIDAARGGENILVVFPNGETRFLSPGPSSVITKAVIEVFAPRFLVNPGVLWVSESRDHVVARDEKLANSIGIAIESDRNLPDIILVDLGYDDPLIVFCEVVATDGPVSQARKKALLAYTRQAGFKDVQAAFLTAYLDRGNQAFKKTFPVLARGTFAWCASEPEQIIALLEEHKTTTRTTIKKIMETVQGE